MRQSPQRSSTWKRLLSWCRRHPIWTAVIVIFIIIASCASNATQSPTTQTSATPTTQVAQAKITQTERPTAKPAVKPTAKPTPRPTPTPTPKPMVIHPTPTPRPATPTPCPGVNCNPFGYNFILGNLITNPPSNFCQYFNCIGNFWNGRGYVNECHDATYSKSGGIQGDCSDHGGYYRTLYSH